MDLTISPPVIEFDAFTGVKTLSIGLFGQFDESIATYLAGHRVIRQSEARDFSVASVIHDLDGIIIRSPFKLDDAAAVAARKLRWIVRAGSGTDNISPAFAANGVALHRTPINAYSVAELVLGLTLGLLRNIRPGHDSLRQGLWKKQTLVGGELRDKTVGILGYGRIGREVSLLMRAVGAKALAFDRTPTAPEKMRVAKLTDTRLTGMDAVIAGSDIVVACLPDSPATKNLFDKTRLRQMRRGALLVNVGRGSLIDLDALTAALESGHLGGAALDVFAAEPPGQLRIFEMDNVLCTPHLGAQTRETHKTIAAGVVEHLKELL